MNCWCRGPRRYVGIWASCCCSCPGGAMDGGGFFGDGSSPEGWFRCRGRSRILKFVWASARCTVGALCGTSSSAGGGRGVWTVLSSTNERALSSMELNKCSVGTESMRSKNSVIRAMTLRRYVGVNVRSSLNGKVGLISTYAFVTKVAQECRSDNIVRARSRNMSEEHGWLDRRRFRLVGSITLPVVKSPCVE